GFHLLLLVADVATNDQGLFKIAHRPVVVPPLRVKLAETGERVTFLSLVTNVAPNGQALFEVAQCSVVVPPCGVELAKVSERRAFLYASRDDGESTLQDTQGALERAQRHLAQAMDVQRPPGRGW